MPVWSTLIDLFPFNLQSAPHRKIRLIESNAKCRHLRGVFQTLPEGCNISESTYSSEVA